jgi:hypothetical protein
MNFTVTSDALKCPACSKGYMLPVEDSFGQQSTSGIKGYICTNPECNNNIFFSRGSVITFVVEKISPPPAR